MQYKIGTCNVVQGQSIVNFADTALMTNAGVGDLFKIQGENAIYQVIGVYSDTQIRISPVYAGTSKSAVRYQICRDRTPNLGLAEINAGDEDWAYWLTNEVIRKMDQVDPGASTLSRLAQLVDVEVGPTEPTDSTKIFWIKTPV